MPPVNFVAFLVDFVEFSFDTTILDFRDLFFSQLDLSPLPCLHATLITVLVSAFPGDLPPRVEEQDIPSPLEGAEGRALIAEATDAFISAQVLVSTSRQYETNQYLGYSMIC